MRNWLLGTTAAMFAFTTAAAQAADVPQASPAPAPEPYYEQAPVANWSGGYLGITGGWASTDLDTDIGDIGDMDGFLAGAYAGYNWQTPSNWVLGIEGDWVYTDLEDDEVFAPGVFANGEVNWLASVRGRAGYALDSVLIYGTGGIAFADVQAAGANAGVTFDDDNTEIGYALGGGLEAMLTDNVTGRLEYLYYDFGGDNDASIHSVRAGIAYKF